MRLYKKTIKGEKGAHRWAEALFGPYLDGELDPKREKKLQDHIKECTPCREALDQEKVLMSGVAGALKPVTIPDRYDISASVAREIRSLENEGVLHPIKRLFPWWGIRPMSRPSFSYAIAAAVGIFIGIFSGILTPGSSNTAIYVNGDSSSDSSLDYMIEKISYSNGDSLTSLYFASETEDTDE
ncbi:MAG: zf-HC2 domain-containing protein [Deltaproteobacteria bacterium]|uniref:Zf-HC2 domain-containing protein n=1 Tax=Candidatus Zymogenus saltonus TaxID=2844893 RepID=A0A9D8KGJ4_9DELT|nr:zf-HC2 domain-containing protein [Candidatus Zymogenus saltonus]